MKKIGISILIILLLSFFKCSEKNKVNAPQIFTKEVSVHYIKATKKYARKMYGAKLDRIVFEVAYTYNQRAYKSNVTMGWMYLSPKLISIVEKKAFEQLIVKCKETSPKEIMIFTRG